MALPQHGIIQKNITRDICPHPTTVLQFLHGHRRGVRQSSLKNAKIVFDSDPWGIICRARAVTTGRQN